MCSFRGISMGFDSFIHRFFDCFLLPIAKPYWNQNWSIFMTFENNMVNKPLIRPYFCGGVHGRGGG